MGEFMMNARGIWRSWCGAGTLARFAGSTSKAAGSGARSTFLGRGV